MHGAAAPIGAQARVKDEKHRKTKQRVKAAALTAATAVAAAAAVATEAALPSTRFAPSDKEDTFEWYGTNALFATGFSIVRPDGKKIAPASRHRCQPDSRAEMMEGIVDTIKRAYSGNLVNVATWDADLKLDSMMCLGLSEFGTARSGNNLEYSFAVFRGAGEMRWKGDLRTGTPDVGCAGNINMGLDSIWFGNTDAHPRNDLYDLVALM
eukprot:g19923.t1